MRSWSRSRIRPWLPPSCCAGGTALHKLLLASPARYSEDIDLVQAHPEPIGVVLDAIRSRLDSWLGKPRRENSAESVSLAYRFESETAPVRPLRLKIEINTREHFAVLGLERRHLTVENPWFHGSAEVPVYHPDELLGTKLRALYQRKKGRDLFDLWLALDRGLVGPRRVVACFLKYMEHAGTSVTRARFEANMAAKAADPAFLRDIEPLLATGVVYVPDAALRVVQGKLIAGLPGDPWKGGRAP